MAKKVQQIVSIVLLAGEAQLEPVLSVVLGSAGVNAAGFISDFNAATNTVPVGTPMQTQITIYDDKSYTFVAIPIY